MDPARQKGFTLVELLIVVALIAILAAWAVPSFSKLAARNTLDRQSDRLWQAITTARLEAAERRTSVHLCPSEDGTQCTSDWQDPLILFDETTADDTRAADEPMIRRFSANVDEVTVQAAGTPANGLSYRPDGFTGEVGNLTLCHPDLGKGEGRRIVISQGRLRREGVGATDC